MATSYLASCTSCQLANIPLQVAFENGADRQAMVSTTCTASTSGFAMLGRRPKRSAPRVHNNSAQRSSMIQPMVAWGKASRSKATAGIVWITSPMELSRTMRIRLTDAGDVAAFVGATGEFSSIDATTTDESSVGMLRPAGILGARLLDRGRARAGAALLAHVLLLSLFSRHCS